MAKKRDKSNQEQATPEKLVNIDSESNETLVPDTSGQNEALSEAPDKSANETIVTDPTRDRVPRRDRQGTPIPAAPSDGQSNDVPTVVADRSAPDATYMETMRPSAGAEERSDDLESDIDETVVDTASDSGPGGLSSLFRDSASGGFGKSLVIRNRPVRGDAPFDSRDVADADYEITEKLAEGGMGVVYVARQLSLSRQLAIKTLKPLGEREKKAFGGSGRIGQITRQRSEMFLSEAIVTGNLVHPNIVPIHDLCETADGTPFYSMKQVDGKPWNHHIRDMTEEENLDVLLKVADAIAYAHHNGVVNRDLKPENVMIGEFGEVIVLDWGLAVPAPESGQAEFKSGTTSFGAGTPAYMSPELWAGPAEKVGKASDIYLLGAILFEAVTGAPPHMFPPPPKGAAKSQMYTIIDSVVRPNLIRPIEEELQGELLDIALKALETDPADRHQSVREFQEAIRKYQQHEESRRLMDRADVLLKGKCGEVQESYNDYQTATALYREALVGWEENVQAKQGLKTTQVKYATLALNRGDYDLGLQLVAHQHGSEFEVLRSKLTKAKSRRSVQKWTSIVLGLIFFTVGPYLAVVFKGQADENAELLGDVRTARREIAGAETRKAAAESAAAEADQKAIQAVAKQDAAEKAAVIAQELAETADSKARAAETDRLAAVAARDKATEDLKDAEAATLAANMAKATAEKAAIDAQMKATTAAEEQMVAEQAARQAQLAAQQAESARARAQVEQENQIIIGLITGGDFASALQRIDELLKSDMLEQLSEIDQAERRRELEAQKSQLSRRAKLTDSSVQLQVISSDSSTVAWAHSDRTVTLWKCGADGTVADSSFNRLSLADVGEIHDLKMLDSALIIAAGRTVRIWDFVNDSLLAPGIKTFESDITALQVWNGLAIAGHRNGQISGWDLDSGAIRWVYDTGSSIRDLEFVPDSSMLLYAGSRANSSAVVHAIQVPEDGSRPLRLGQLKYTLDSNRPPHVLKVSPDGKVLIISNSQNGDLLILPRSDGDFPFRSPAEFELSGWVESAHRRPVNDISFSADGNRFVTASDDRTIGVWDIRNQPDGRVAAVLLKQMKGHGASVTSADFSGSDRNRILSTSRDRYCRSWNIATYEHEIENLIPSDRTTSNVSFMPESGFGSHRNVRSEVQDQYSGLQSVSRYKLAQLQDQRADVPFVILNSGEHRILRGGIQSIELDPSGSRVVSGGVDGTAVMWDARTGSPVTGGANQTRFHQRGRLFEAGHRFNVSRLLFLPSKNPVLLTTSFDGSLCLWDADVQHAERGAEKARITDLGLINAVGVSTNGEYLVTSTAPHETPGSKETGFPCAMWSVPQLLSGDDPVAQTQLNGVHRDVVTTIAVSPDNRLIATGAKDGAVAIWRAQTGDNLTSITGHTRNTIVSGLQWVDSRRLISVGLDGAIRLWSVADDSQADFRMKLVRSFAGSSRSPVDQIVLSPTGRQFLTVTVTFASRTAAPTYEALLWNVDDRESVGAIRLAAIEGRTPDTISSVAWSSTGEHAAIVAQDQINILDASTWQVTRVLKGTAGGITDAIFVRPDDQSQEMLATFDGNAAHLWNLKDARHLSSFRRQESVAAVALSHDINHRFLATGSRAIRIFNSDAGSSSCGQTLFKSENVHKGRITSLKFTPGDKAQRLVSGGDDGVAIVWSMDTASGMLVADHTFTPRQGKVSTVSWSADAQYILIVAEQGATIVEMASEKMTPLSLAEFNSAETVLLCGAFNSTGREVALGGQSVASGASIGFILRLSETTGRFIPHARFSGHGAGGITGTDFIPDTSYLVTTGVDGAAIVWNWQPRDTSGMADLYQAYRFLGPKRKDAHAAGITGLSVARDGTIATCSGDGTAIVWKNPLAAMPGQPL